VAKRDYYETLEVERTAGAEDIKKAYRKLAKQYHPDLNKGKGSTERFKEVAEAYEILSDPDKRAQYDRFGHAGPDQHYDFGDVDFRRARQTFEEFGFGGLDSIFDMFFGQGSRTQQQRSRTRRGPDLEYRVRITLEDAAFGTKLKVTIPRQVACSHCKGTGAQPGSKVRVCPSCNGTGELQYHQQTLLGSFVNIRPCERCEGAGELVEQPCRHCHGQGRKKEDSQIAINIPPGVDSGSRLRLKGLGSAGVAGGELGDLYIVVQVTPHERFTRKEDDLLCTVTVRFTAAALGGTVKVHTLSGEETLKIPPGTQPGTTFRIAGKGIPHLRGSGQGDLFCKVHIEVPKHLTSQQKKALKELEELEV